jgi:hypothetical protein
MTTIFLRQEETVELVEAFLSGLKYFASAITGEGSRRRWVATGMPFQMAEWPPEPSQWFAMWMNSAQATECIAYQNRMMQSSGHE